MSMSKKDFIALADNIRSFNLGCAHLLPGQQFSELHLANLADFCRSQNPAFNRERWLGYIKGQNGPSGGKVKA
jgi:hypothetical protein